MSGQDGKPRHLERIKRLLNTPGALVLFLSIFIFIQLYVSFSKKNWSFEAWKGAMVGWDGAWYYGISMRGYDLDQAFAFFPLWPLIVRFAANALGTEIYYNVGAAVSLGLFIIALIAIAPKNDDGIRYYSPGDRHVTTRHYIELFPLIFAPSAWVFCTNHTESLFLLLTVLGLQAAFKEKLWKASVYAGLAALTRNQGIIFALAVGTYFLLDTKKPPSERLRNFVISGAISAALFALWPLYQYHETGDFFASVSVQDKWGHVGSVAEYMQAILAVGSRSIEREILFWSILATGLFFIFEPDDRRKNISVGMYLLLSVILWPYQGEGFANAFRYSVVIFPFWLLIGRQLASLLSSDSIGKVALAVVIAGAFIEKLIWIGGRYYSHIVWPY